MIIIENIVLCADCVPPAVNDDYSGLEYHYKSTEADEKMRVIEGGLKKLGPGLCYDSSKEQDEFSAQTCDCCGSRLAVSREYFVIIKEENQADLKNYNHKARSN